MTRFRAFRNEDAPALADLWNRGLPERCVVRPLSVHEFDALVMGKLGFEAAGLIVAERDGRPVGFAHAGFGPEEPRGLSRQLDTALGTVAMLVLEPGLDDAELETGLFRSAESYLRGRGAQVLYAGGQPPLDPFYWGLYGGSEFSGILSGHESFQRAAQRAGYEPVSRSRVLEVDLSRPEPRDPKLLYLRRQVHVEVVEDAPPEGWWEALAIGLFRPTRFELRRRSDNAPIARAGTWEIASGLAPGDGRPRAGLIDVLVEPGCRRQGFGRLLVTEVLRHSREQLAEIVAVHVGVTNHAALSLYTRLGFEPVEETTLYRLPAEPAGRSPG